MQVGSHVRVGAPFDVSLPGVYVIVGVSETGAWQIETDQGVLDFDETHLILEE
jgi:hypothetical protein